MMQQWAQLEGRGPSGSSFDAVIHNGVMVNWIMDYQSLKAQNVLSTLQLLQACRSSGTHHALIYVSGGQVWKGVEIEGASALTDVNEMNGYDMGKLMSEQLVKAFARDQGQILAIIVRPGYIIGGLDKSAANTNDFLWRAVAASINVGRFTAESENSWLYACGADHVADKIVESLDHDTSLTQGCAVSNVADGLRVSEFWDIISDCGFDLAPAKSSEWVELVDKRIDQMAGSLPLWPLRDYIHTHNAALGVSRVETKDFSVEGALRLRTTIRNNTEYLKRIGYFDDIER